MDAMEDVTKVEMKFYDLSMALTTCPLCLDTLTIPKILPCLHTFCLDCLTSHYNATNSQRLVFIPIFKCPECRSTCYVSSDLSQLPTDFRLSSILELIKSIDVDRIRTKV